MNPLNADILKTPPKYYFEIDLGGDYCDSYEPQFASYDNIVAEGDTLEECLENAVCFISDQDGGTLGDEPADQDWMQDLIKEQFAKEQAKCSCEQAIDETGVLRNYVCDNHKGES